MAILNLWSKFQFWCRTPRGFWTCMALMSGVFAAMYAVDRDPYRLLTGSCSLAGIAVAYVAYRRTRKLRPVAGDQMINAIVLIVGFLSSILATTLSVETPARWIVSFLSACALIFGILVAGAGRYEPAPVDEA